MKTFFQTILDFLYRTFFVKDIVPLNSGPVPVPPEPVIPPTPAPVPTPPVSPGKIDKWCEAIKKMEGAKPSRNNPGNLRFVGQMFAVNDNGFCKFDTYQHGYNALKKLLVNACTGKSKVYHPTMTLYDFYNVYAPSSDGNNPKHYAEFVAKVIGVSPTIQIRELL